MATSTNSSAFLRLKPLENTNTGSIVQEHIRYWTKYKDDTEALELSRKAKENEFKRKKNGEDFAMYDGLSGIEAKGYFTEQIIKYKEANAEKWLDLSKRVGEGDDDAKIKYAQEKEKLNNLINASTVVEEQSKKLYEQKKSGHFNPYLDQGLSDFVDTLSKSNYVLDPNLGKFRIYDKENPKVLLEVDPLALSSDFLNSSYNKSVDFTTTGKTLGKDLLNTIDGNEQITPETRIKGIQLAKNQLDQDQTLAKSWYLSQKKNGKIKNTKQFEELDKNELVDLAGNFYEGAILPNITETTKDTRLDDAIKNETLAEKIRNRKKAEEEEKESKSNIFVTSDEDGNDIRRQETLGGLPRVSDYLVNDKLYTIKGEATTQDVKGNTTTTTTYTNLGMGKNGVVAIGTRTVSELIKDSDPPKYRTTTEPYVETDKVKLNTIATKIKDEKGKIFNGLAPLTEFLKSLIDETKAEVTTKEATTTTQTKFN